MRKFALYKQTNSAHLHSSFHQLRYSHRVKKTRATAELNVAVHICTANVTCSLGIIRTREGTGTFHVSVKLC